jgi:hypothetical protein
VTIRSRSATNRTPSGYDSRSWIGLQGLAVIGSLLLIIFPGGGVAGNGKGQPAGRQAPASTDLPSISGSPVVGQTLTASAGSWSGPVSSYAYQWLRCDSSGNACSSMAGATNASYSPVSADLDCTLRVSVTASNKYGSSLATSAATSAVTTPATTSAPSDTTSPVISGTAIVSQTLTASPGTWTGSPTLYTYQWRRCDSSGAGCSDVASATSTSYVISTLDAGSTMRVAVTASNASGSTMATSSETSVITTGTTGAKLTWAPPALSNPVTVNVPSSGGTVNLDSTRDYIVNIGNVSAIGGVILNGGHNVVAIGGHITIPWAGSTPSPSDRRALELKNQTGVVHVEGLLIDNAGGDLGEGIQIADENAVVQIENVRVTDIHARDEVGFTDTHPDIIQPWGGYKELRVDRLT